MLLIFLLVLNDLLLIQGGLYPYGSAVAVKDKDLCVPTKPGCAQHQHILQSCKKKKKKAAMLKELFSFVF